MSERNPEMGSQPSCTPKRIISSSASQKSGVAKPRKTKIVVTLSNVEYCRVADMTPIGTARARMISISMTLSSRVMGSRSPILVSTSRPSGANERPKSRRTMRLSQFQYCTCSGLSRPYISRRAL